MDNWKITFKTCEIIRKELSSPQSWMRKYLDPLSVILACTPMQTKLASPYSQNRVSTRMGVVIGANTYMYIYLGLPSLTSLCWHWESPIDLLCKATYPFFVVKELGSWNGNLPIWSSERKERRTANQVISHDQTQLIDCLLVGWLLRPRQCRQRHPFS
jgi:hypothetical protein